MKFPRPNSRWLLALMLASALMSLAGCSSDTSNEPANMSERPWNAPTSWDNGLPSSLTEGH
jgi:outer membrane biogenesis lipoprotein LolB